jgi:hypothetical protein
MLTIEKSLAGAITFAVAFICLTVLVYFGKAQSETLAALLAWLVPSPIRSLESK